MPVRVFDPVFVQPKIQYQPQEVFRVRGFGGGLDVLPPQVGRFVYTDLVGMSVFRVTVSGHDQIHMLLFRQGRTRPLDIDDPGKIQYDDFLPAGSAAQTGMDKFRQVAVLLAASAGLIVVDRGTATFLQGGHVQLLTKQGPHDVATAFASVVSTIPVHPPASVPAPQPPPAAPPSPQPPYAAPQPAYAAPPQPQQAVPQPPYAAPQPAYAAPPQLQQAGPQPPYAAPKQQPLYATPPQPQPPQPQPPQPQYTAPAPPGPPPPPPPPPAPSTVARPGTGQLPRPVLSASAEGLPLLAALAYPVRGRGLIAWLCFGTLYLAIAHFRMQLQWGWVAILSVIGLWYIPSLLLAVVRHGFKDDEELRLPKVFDLEERLSDAAVTVVLIIVFSLIYYLCIFASGLIGATLNLPPIFLVLLLMTIFVGLMQLMSLGFGAMGSYGQRQLALRLDLHSNALRPLTGTLFLILFVSVGPVALGGAVLVTALGLDWEIIAQQMALLVQGQAVQSGRDQLIVFYMILHFSTGFATVANAYLMGAMFRVRSHVLSQIYLPAAPSKAAA